MLKFPLWKKLSIAAVLIAGLVFALPNLLNEQQRETFSKFLPASTINLGLDLQGGSHLVLEVDINAVVVRDYENLEEEIRLLLLNEKFNGQHKFNFRDLQADSNKGIHFTAFNKQQQEAILALLRDQVNDVLVAIEDDKISVARTPTYLQQLGFQAMAQTLEIMRARVDEFGVAEPMIQRQGDTRVIVELPGIDDVERAKNIIGRTAQLTFHMVEKLNPTERDIRRPRRGSAVFYGSEKDPLTGEESRIPYLLKKRPAITGEHLSRASAGFSSETSEPAVFLTFDGVGTRKFGKVTTEFQGRNMAIVLDGKVYSAPTLREPILGGNAVITGSFNPKETEDLATVLRAGALPAPVNFAEERTVGPSLGRDSIEAGKVAIIIGFIGVMILMLLFYRGFGVAANVALLFNVVLILAIMTAFGATLTLPGMAGIVLTIGMAVDANVLIFERIREETRSGKSPMMAMDNGFKSAMGTILDANITTLIAAVVLFSMGSGPIKGFALTLSVGIVSSMFTAIMVTRLMLVVWLLKVRPKKLAV